MPRTLSFPRPSPHVCPVCDERLAALPCGSCRADLRRPEGAELLRVDRMLYDLSVERSGLVRRLLEPAHMAAPAPGDATSPPPPPPPPPLAVAPSRWSMAEILAGLGGLSLVAAVAVFVAVAWSDLAAWAQGALLLGATAGVVAGAHTLHRRGLTATAESLGVVGVALGLADIEVVRVALTEVFSGRSVWALGLAIVAIGSVVVGRRSGLVGMTGIGVALGFVPAIVALSGARPPSQVAFTLVAQCAVGVALEASIRLRGSSSSTQRVAARAAGVGATSSAVGAVVVGLSIASDPWGGASPASTSAVGVFLSLALVAVGGAVAGGWRRSTSASVLSLGSLSVLVAAWASAPSEPSTLAVVALASAAVAILSSVLVRLDPERPWSAPVGTAVAAAGALALVPLASVAAALAGVAEIASRSPEVALSDGVGEILGSDSSFLASDLPSAAHLPVLLALAAAGAAAWSIGRRWGSVALGVAAAAASVAVFVVADLPVAVAVAVAAASWALGVAMLLDRPDGPWRTASLAASGALLVLFSIVSEPTAVVGAIVLVIGMALVAHRGLLAGLPSAPAWLALSLVTAIGSTAVVGTRLGASGSAPALLTLGAAALASTVAPLVDARFGDRCRPAVASADAVVGASLVLALLAMRSVDAASIGCGAVAVLAGLHAARPDRRWAIGAALGSIVVLTWLRLVAAEITVLEAYTLPLAGALLVGGALAGGDERSSWVRNGAGLFAALAPSAVLAVGDGDLLRTVVVVVSAGCAVCWGAILREQAPLAVGGVVLGLVALRHLGPIAAEAPRYLAFGVVGVTLLAAGATFERRRSDVRRALEAFAELS